MTRRWLLAWLSAILPSGLIGSRALAQYEEEPSAGDIQAIKGERREPLFLSGDDAARVIREYSVLEGETRLDNEQIELLFSRLQGQI